jgi:hypothetical protein
MGVRPVVLVEIVRAVLESLPLLEVEAVALLVDVEAHREARERLGAFEVAEIALKALVFQGMKRWVFTCLGFRISLILVYSLYVLVLCGIFTSIQETKTFDGSSARRSSSGRNLNSLGSKLVVERRSLIWTC